MLVIKNGLVHDAINKTPYTADIVCENGKIISISGNVDVADSKEVEVIDATGLHIYPGFVEAHGHIGLDGYGIGYEGQDYNELNDPITPQLNAIDGINPFDEAFEYAREAGVTTVATGPGSSNVLGGTFTAIKTYGKRIDNMIVKDKVAMKCAFGENPKRCYKTKSIYSRMTTAAKLREMLYKAKEYNAKIKEAGEDISKRPAFDYKLEALLPVVNKEIPLKAHAHRADDIFTAIRIAKDLDVKLTLEHCTEGHLIVDELVKENYPVAVGPSFGQATKVELKNKTFKTPGVLSKAGLNVSIITDCPVIPLQYLPLCAGLAVESGMDPFDALKAITINPAKHLGIEDRVGSISVSKDADFVITDGVPFNIETKVRYTIIGSEIVYKR